MPDTSRPLEAQDLYRLRFVSDAQVSPDGRRVAYVVSRVDGDDRTTYRSQIVLVDLDHGTPRPLTAGLQRDRAPRWAPDGRLLAFLSDRVDDLSQVFVLPLDGGEPRQLTHLPHGAGAPVWSPDGTRLALAADVDIAEVVEQEGIDPEAGKPPRVKIVTRVHYKADGQGYREGWRRHLFVVDVDGGLDAAQLTSGDWDDADPAWSPDGRQIVFASSREADRDLTLLSDLWAVSSDGGQARRLTEHTGEASAPAWSPDGTRIAYLGHSRGWSYGPTTRVMVVPADGGPSEPLAPAFQDEAGNVALSDARDPFAAQPPHWLPDGESVLTLTSRDGCVHLVRLGPIGATTLVDGRREVASFSADTSGQTLACVVSDPAHPYEVFLTSADSADERQLSHENEALLLEVALAPVEAIAARSSDGETVHGWVMRPTPGAAQAPLVLEIHGGPEAMYAWSFMHEFQVLAGRGFGVVYGNPRGSRGYGEAFTARIFADWGNQDAADCLALTEAAVALPWVDERRVGVTGGSYGGFMTAWLVGHSQRFQAAVATRGCYSFESMYGTSDIGPWFLDYVLGGPVYERRELYRERSPLTYAPAMRTPLLLIHNEQDLRCPMEQAEQLFVQLRRLGRVETELVRFPDESHNLSRSGRPDRRVERVARIVDWMERHLGQGSGSWVQGSGSVRPSDR
jgi:dipeptidyl aminopeptidase/acylaminoacyl peptidase